MKRDSQVKKSLIKIFQTIKKLWHTQEFGFEIHSGEVTRKQPEPGCPSCT